MSVSSLSDLKQPLARLANWAGDEEAWAELYQQMWPFVLAVMYRRLRAARGLAEDGAQEVFLRLARSCPFERLQDPDAFRRYVWRVADNVARTHLRRLVSRESTEISASDPEQAASGSVGSPLQPTEPIPTSEELLGHVWSELTASDRLVLTLILRGKTLSEIAKTAGLGYANAGVRVYRLRARLRKLLFQKESGQVLKL